MDQFTTQTTQIVTAYLRHNPLVPDQIPALIQTVHEALAHITTPLSIPTARPEPAVSIRKSLTDNHIICLDCGYQGTMLKRHLMSSHNMTPQDYRERWSLATDFPMLARGYSARRSALAKQIGLGLRGSRVRGGQQPPAEQPPVEQPVEAEAPIQETAPVAEVVEKKTRGRGKKTTTAKTTTDKVAKTGRSKPAQVEA